MKKINDLHSFLKANGDINLPSIKYEVENQTVETGIIINEPELGTIYDIAPRLSISDYEGKNQDEEMRLK